VCRDAGAQGSRSDERRPGEAIPALAIIQKDADPAAVSQRLGALGAHDMHVNDDRGLGGSLSVRFSAPDVDSLTRIVQLDEVQWVEPPPCINLDGG
jgi:hypothetical protein